MVRDFNSLQSYFRSAGVFDQLKVEKIGVFGSLARGESFNDIDILVDQSVPFEDVYKLQLKMEAELQAHVDIMIKELAEPIILYRALKDIRYATRD